MEARATRQLTTFAMLAQWWPRRATPCQATLFGLTRFGNALPGVARSNADECTSTTWRTTKAQPRPHRATNAMPAPTQRTTQAQLRTNKRTRVRAHAAQSNTSARRERSRRYIYGTKHTHRSRSKFLDHAPGWPVELAKTTDAPTRHHRHYRRCA